MTECMVDQAGSGGGNGGSVTTTAMALVRGDERVSLSLEFADCGRLVERALHPDALDHSRVCYLLCPAACTIAQIIKFLTLKLDLESHLEVSIFYTDDVLSGDYTLMDVAYVYSWRRRGPLRLFYTVVDPSVEVNGNVAFLMFAIQFIYKIIFQPLDHSTLPLVFKKLKTETEDEQNADDEDDDDIASNDDT